MEKDTNKSVVSYKLTDTTKLKLRSVMGMMSANGSVNYDEMFSFMADFYIEQNNVNIQKRRKKLTEQKNLLEKLEGKIERKLEKIYKNQKAEMWNYLSKFEKRENYYHDKVSEMQRLQNIESEKLIKSTSEEIKILLHNSGALNEEFCKFSKNIQKFIENNNEFLSDNTKNLQEGFDNLIRSIKVAMGKASPAELEIVKQAEAKIKAEKAKQEEERKIIEAQKYKWYRLPQEQVKMSGFDYKEGIVFARDSDNNAISILCEQGKDTLVQVKFNGKFRNLPLINKNNRVRLIMEKIEQQYEKLFAGQNNLSFL